MKDTHTSMMEEMKIVLEMEIKKKIEIEREFRHWLCCVYVYYAASVRT